MEDILWKLIKIGLIQKSSEADFYTLQFDLHSRRNWRHFLMKKQHSGLKNLKFSDLNCQETVHICQETWGTLAQITVLGYSKQKMPYEKLQLPEARFVQPCSYLFRNKSDYFSGNSSQVKCV